MADEVELASLVARLRADGNHERHVAVQALRELCLPKTERCVENRAIVGELGGVELMVQMLDISNCDIQRSTCLALNEACLKNSTNSRTFQTCGAIPRVMRVLRSGNPDLQTQALAVLGTSAVNAVEVRRGLRDAGAIPLLVSLLGSKTAAVQEWAAYALRKASSRATDVQLGKSTIEQAVQAGADRLLVSMLSLRSREAHDEAQQTLEYFGVDVDAVQSHIRREDATRPLVGMQRMCWVAVYHRRLGCDSPARRLPLELVELIAHQCAPAASEDVVARWESQGLAWVESLNWQKRTQLAERRVGRLSERLSSVQAQVAEISARDQCLLALERRVDRVDHRVRALQQKFASAEHAPALRTSLVAMTNEIGGMLNALGELVDVAPFEAAAALPAPPIAAAQLVGRQPLAESYRMSKASMPGDAALLPPPVGRETVVPASAGVALVASRKPSKAHTDTLTIGGPTKNASSKAD
eukprot:COSAG01_NODE_5242_length_4389_cov_100.681352_1_plen_471_part_00